MNSNKELTHQVIGVTYDVYNELGFGYQEKYYYRAIKIKLLEKGLEVAGQLNQEIVVGGQSIGRYYLDFLVSNGDERVILELKIAEKVYPQHIRQVLGYLKAHKMKYGLIAAFGTNGVIIKRVAN